MRFPVVIMRLLSSPFSSIPFYLISSSSDPPPPSRRELVLASYPPWCPLGIPKRRVSLARRQRGGELSPSQLSDAVVGECLLLMWVLRVPDEKNE